MNVGPEMTKPRRSGVGGRFDQATIREASARRDIKDNAPKALNYWVRGDLMVKTHIPVHNEAAANGITRSGLRVFRRCLSPLNFSVS
jgi:hypothetical protein